MNFDDGDAAAAASHPPTPTEPRESLVRTAFVTEESIYGVLLVSGMIVVTGSHGSNSWQVFWTVIVTVLVFWAAHVYAGTVARHGLAVERVMGLRDAFGESMRRSLGLLLSALIPSAILLLGVLEVVPDLLTIWLALWAGVVVLAVLGFVAYRRRGAPLHLQLLGAVGTAAFGLVMILLKAIIH
ncbi:hypothetical protein MUN74_13705 [Agromyces endophyticus]|uniref:hypothetical protein n=1 Tax=Agromyces sp. H17E-10 TaxID=2932244 RepID=UPI001FD43374|nr:hypothetical protein [Agromyces sp. H17E-10]UOQ88329.1 hypothetical protein MUN74_13705 [Agromyces sp. H17E-10]